MAKKTTAKDDHAAQQHEAFELPKLSALDEWALKRLASIGHQAELVKQKLAEAKHQASAKEATPARARNPRNPRGAKSATEDDAPNPGKRAKPAKRRTKGDAAKIDGDVLAVATALGVATFAIGDILPTAGTRGQVSGALERLVAAKKLDKTGVGRGTKYALPSSGASEPDES